jgi:hypothetical protein
MCCILVTRPTRDLGNRASCVFDPRLGRPNQADEGCGSPLRFWLVGHSFRKPVKNAKKKVSHLILYYVGF